jgi:Raf kinase inhibitor-like YbhB/YbcL family protein
MQITSTAFVEGGSIPQKYTCDGENVSPPLAWSGVPANAQALALIVDDPDAPAGTWVHWVVLNLPPASGGLPEAVPAARATLQDGTVQATSSYRKVGYGGPCPPSGTHRYYFKLYALDGKLNLTSGVTAKDLQGAMQGHVLAEAQLMGRYQRSK